jgi:hypothetical protein
MRQRLGVLLLGDFGQVAALLWAQVRFEQHLQTAGHKEGNRKYQMPGRGEE